MDTLRKGDVATPGQLAKQGISQSQQRIMIREGRLELMQRGVYADAARLRAAKDAASDGNPALLHAFHVAAALQSGRKLAAASHQSAAILWGLDLLNPPPHDFVTLTRPPDGKGRRTNTDRLHIHVAPLANDLCKRYGLPATAAPRAVIDLARSIPFMNGVVVADSALHSGTVTEAELSSKLLACERWAGSKQARQVIAFADRRSESPLESCARVTFHKHKLPPPELQVETCHEGQFIARVDFLWPQFRTVAEADGLLKYSSRRDALAQLERDKKLRAAGYKVVHFTYQQLFWETWRVIGWLRQAFAQPGPF